MVDLLLHRNITNNIQIQPWCLLNANGGEQLILKYFFDKSECSYDVLLYDGKQLWCEMIEVGSFKDKCKLFNPNIEAEPSSLLERVESSLQDCLKSSNLGVEVKSDTCIKIQVKSKLQAGIPFSWTFKFQHASIEMLSEHVTNPLTIMVTELFRRQRELFHMLERKDREIQDYKDQGSVVSRRHLETAHFDKTVFQNTSNVNEEFLSTCCNSEQTLSTLTNDGISSLYRNVVMNVQAKHNTVPQATVVGSSASFDTLPIAGRDPAPRVESWANEKRVPGSVVNDNIDGSLQQQTVEPTVPMNDTTPEGAEKNRREALRKRLEDENERKNKKKKRKIKL